MERVRRSGQTGLALAVICMAGCARPAADLVRESRVQVSVLTGRSADITGVTVRETNAGLEVAGEVSARTGEQRPSAVVHAELLDSSGNAITHVDGRPRLHAPSARQNYRSDFRIELPDPASARTTVRVWYGAPTECVCTEHRPRNIGS